MSVFLLGSIPYWKSAQKFSKAIKYKNIYLKKWLTVTNSTHFRQMSQEVSGREKQFVPFLDAINLRREEAKRSILVQVQSSKSYNELHTYCSSIGTVNQMLHYTCGVVEPLHFIIVEFANETDAENVIKSTTFIQDSNVVPVTSSFVWLKASKKKLSKLKPSKNATTLVENSNQVTEDNKIRDQLRNCKNIDEQANVLYNVTKLNDTGTRLRFLTAKQIEMCVSGLFPNAKAYPFGSSVNGYGKMNCDLDLILRLQDNSNVPTDNRLIFHCKAANGSERSVSQRHMETVGDMIHLFLPGCSHVRKILQARVPIIKYHQQLTDVECDLSMSNMSGVYMSDFLYLMGSIDKRVRPIIFTIRKWASEVGITSSVPGRWITNFSLTLLVLAFMQSSLASSSILPSLNSLVKQARQEDVYLTEDGTNCSFLRDLNKFEYKTENTDTIESLLQQFFEYYSQFDYSTKAVCLNESISITKPDHSPLYIVNPLERGLNVSKNVSLEELDKFKLEVRNAAWALESQDSTKDWGILRLFESSKKSAVFSSLINISHKQSRLMEVSKLFGGESEDAEVEFKNEQVKFDVGNIKGSTRKTIKKIEKSLKNR